ncbi:hypothetical protein DYQ86_20975 [Acidobacteria bacterium AB60]|nr:hypothetical protein DYQ86_20975 [Acidobacteria bacterium AB60]
MIASFLDRIRRTLIPKSQGNLDHHARGRERNRRAVITGGTAALARLVQVGTSLITVPLTLKYLGNERFGLWMTINSVLAMASFADFGVGNGVLTAVATAFGQDDMRGVRRVVSSGFVILSSIAALLLLSFLALFSYVNWGDFFRVLSPLARAEAGPALFVFAACFALNISMDVVQRVQLGLQQGYRYGLWQMCGSLAGLIGIIAGIHLHVGLPLLVVAISGAPLLAVALNTAHFFGFVRPDLRPDFALVSRDVIAQITRLGGLFFILQLVAMLASSADNFIIARTLGAVNVPEYSIPQRMFSLIGVLVAMLLAPLWPAYGEAIARGDLSWVRRTMKRSFTLSLSVTLVVSALLLVLAPTILEWWVGRRIHPPFLLLLGLAIWPLFEACNNTVGPFLNAAAIIRFQIGISVLFGLTCLSLKLLLLTHLGVVAIPWSTILSSILVQVIPWLLFVPRILRKLEEKSWNGVPSQAEIQHSEI